jgi:hypothetical protein
MGMSDLQVVLEQAVMPTQGLCEEAEENCENCYANFGLPNDFLA